MPIIIMGIDTRFFGPSGWQLYHYISFHSNRPHKFLKNMKEILPCKFCRASTAEFSTELPLSGNPSKWLYNIHNKVNHKLRTQCLDDPNVVNPGPDPSFEEIKNHYENLKLTNILGRDFLFSVASNYPDIPEPINYKIQTEFLEELSKVYPFPFIDFLKSNPPALSSRKEYMKWMYSLFEHLAPQFNAELPSYNGLVQRAMYYTSGCERKSYKGKTCRRIKGGRTKNRDNTRTFRITHSSLCS